MKGFIAYPAQPPELVSEITATLPLLRDVHGLYEVTSWREHDVAGRFLVTPILDNIRTCDFLVADVTTLNFNVAFEIGYAIGASRRVLLVKSALFAGDTELFPQLGIFDTLGYKVYSNPAELAKFIATLRDTQPLALAHRHSSGRPRLFLIEPPMKSSYDISLASSIKKARIGFERYDPVEKGRLSAPYAIASVGKEDAIIAAVLPATRLGAIIHNIRVAFCAGLAHAMGRECILLQESEEPVPLDYRDLVRWVAQPNEISRVVGDLALRLYATIHENIGRGVSAPTTLLEKVDLGSSIAENESRELDNYYLETEHFQRALRGELQVITGRKGSGKTAFFIELRNRLRRNPQNIVLDLQPEGYQMLKFKERCLSLLTSGSREHLLTALWEYILLLEIAIRVLRDDRGIHLRNHRLYSPYRHLEGLIRVEGLPSGDGDFAERLERILEQIEADTLARIDRSRHDNTLSNPVVVELLHQRELRELRTAIEEYVTHKSGVWILLDNLDKGWPAKGLTDDDTRIIRCLQNALIKIERPLRRHEVTCQGIVFLRADVYELLVASTPDKGKIQRANLDLTNPDILREILRLRIAFSINRPDIDLDEIWPQLFMTHIEGTADESCQFLIDRSLMRPRCLLDLVQACRSNAVTLRRTKVVEDDIREGIGQYSIELASNVCFEIRDVYPNSPDVIFALFGCGRRLKRSDLLRLLAENGIVEAQLQDFLDILLWYGVLGLVAEDDTARYIFHERYELRKLKRIHGHLADSADPSYEINPAFWAALDLELI